MSEARGGPGGGGGDGGRGGGDANSVDPSNLHLRKELSQIRKAARVLRDPGTTSSWRSPLSSARSAVANVASSSTVNHCYHHYKNDYGVHIQGNLNGLEDGRLRAGDKSLQPYNQFPPRGEGTTGGSGKEKKVFLYNWRVQKSESDRSAATRQSRRHEKWGDRLVNDHCVDGSSSSSVPEESVEDSSSDARHGGNDSKSDTYITNRYASMIFKCKDSGLTPSIKRTIKKKSKRSAHSAAILKYHHQLLRQHIIEPSRSSKRVIDGPGRNYLASLSDQTDDTEEYCNSQDLQKVSAASPLLARLKHKNWSHSSSKLLRSSKKEDSSYSYSTPALSTSSYNKYGNRNRSTVGSWDATTASFNDGDDEVDDQLDLPGRQGCGIPCYWSRRSTPKYRGGSGSCYSPSFSDTLRRKGSNILCGSQIKYHRRRRGSSLGSKKRKIVSRTAQGHMPLLTNSVEGRGTSSVGTGNSDDELSTNIGELDLEALSRLDGRRWSTSCRSLEGLELVALNGEVEEGSSPENIRSLSQKYRPMFFEELIGQNIVVHSLMNAITRGRIAPVYLFQGPRGTGKTSTARIFSAALNCLASQETKPCGVCRECADFISGKSRNLREVDGTNKKGIERIRNLLKNLSASPLLSTSHYRVFVIDECHLLPSKTWLTFLKFLEEPPPRVVFIFVTTDLDNVPRTVLSRCQKYLFNKIKDTDIVTRLRKIAADENLDVEPDALALIALNADGSLRDAETMLDQLSLLGKRINTSLVNELVGVVSDEKLLELLELAMSSDTAETVKRTRELMDSGVDPMVLMSQLATLIMDIIAGTYQIVDTNYSDPLCSGRSLTEAELERLKHALKLLSDAEKQLRVSSERSTWFTATLLQLGSVPSPDRTQSGSSRRQSSKTTEDDRSAIFREVINQKQRLDVHHAGRKSTSPISLHKAAHQNSTSQENSLPLANDASFSSKPSHQLISDNEFTISHDDSMVGNAIVRCLNSNSLDDIWIRCIEKCHSMTLRQLLHSHGKLVSISEVEGVFVTYIAFDDGDIKMRAERFLSSITNSFEIVLRHNVDVRLILVGDGEMSITSGKRAALPDSLGLMQRDANNVLSLDNNAIDTYHSFGSLHDRTKASQGSLNGSEGKLVGIPDSVDVNVQMIGTKEGKSEIPVHRIESIIHEQRLETAWLQAAEKGTPGSLSRLKPERNQVLPQDGLYHHNKMESINSIDLPSQHWEDEVNHELRTLKINDEKTFQKDHVVKKVDHYPMSPSLLHDSNFMGNFSTESMGYESGSGAGGCSGLFCWSNARHNRRGKKGGRFLLFGECGKPRRRTDSRFKIQ